MPLPTLVASAIVIVIAFFTSASHVGICVGPAVGTGFLGKRSAVAMYIAMVLIGAYTQGVLMTKAVFNPSICSLATTVVIALAPSLAGIPLSLNFALYTSQIGCSMGRGIEKLVSTATYWATILSLTSILSLIVMTAIRSYLSSRSNPIRVLSTSRIAINALALAMSYVVGANTFGFLIHFASASLASQIALIVAITIGATLMHSKSLERVAYRFFRIGVSHAITCYAVSIAMLEVATLLSIPLPASLTITTALYFSGYVAPFRILKSRNYYTYLLVQLLSIPIALATGTVLASLIKW